MHFAAVSLIDANHVAVRDASYLDPPAPFPVTRSPAGYAIH